MLQGGGGGVVWALVFRVRRIGQQTSESAMHERVLERVGPDAVAVSTPSHGGIWVSPGALAWIPEPLRATACSGGGWFEVDCNWCIPYLALGLHAFEAPAERQDRVRATARRTLETWHAAHAGLLEPSPASAENHQGPTHD